jgi:hypothetical protein
MEHSSGRIGQTEGEFSVCQFFENEFYEYTRRYVGPEEAVLAFKHYTTSVAAQMGIVRRVIITDGGDFTTMEWQYGKGITFPTKEELQNARAQEPKED